MYNFKKYDNIEEKVSKKRDIKVNFGQIYIFLLIFSGSLIYFYSVYQNNYLSIFIPYRILWPISIIFIGISILRAKNTAAFSIGFFITTLSVGITITSFFVYSTNVENNVSNSMIPIMNASGISSNIELVATQAKLKSEDINMFKGEVISNYDKINFINYRDQNNIENIKLEQTLFPPGIGSYNKSSNIVFPTDIPISFNINSNVSSIDIELSNLKLKSSSIKSNNSNIDLVIKDINLDEEVILDISSNLSRLNIIISKDIPIIVSNSSTLSQTEFLGIIKNPNASNVYQTTIQDYSLEELFSSEKSQEEAKKLIINLRSTLSQIKITQK
jgi:hypothetical protein